MRENCPEVSHMLTLIGITLIIYVVLYLAHDECYYICGATDAATRTLVQHHGRRPCHMRARFDAFRRQPRQFDFKSGFLNSPFNHAVERRSVTTLVVTQETSCRRVNTRQPIVLCGERGALVEYIKTILIN